MIVKNVSNRIHFEKSIFEVINDTDCYIDFSNGFLKESVNDIYKKKK